MEVRHYRASMFSVQPYGGPTNFGLVYQMNPLLDGQWNYNLIYNFQRIAGGTAANLTLDSVGDLYGTAKMDGGHGVRSTLKVCACRPVGVTIVKRPKMVSATTPNVKLALTGLCNCCFTLFMICSCKQNAEQRGIISENHRCETLEKLLGKKQA